MPRRVKEKPSVGAPAHAIGTASAPYDVCTPILCVAHLCAHERVHILLLTVCGRVIMMALGASGGYVVTLEMWLRTSGVIVLYHIQVACTATAALESGEVTECEK